MDFLWISYGSPMDFVDPLLELRLVSDVSP
jgi:hypothetical protein